METNESVQYAVAILNKYRKAAIDKKNMKAKKEVEHVMKVFNKLHDKARGNK